MSFFTRARRSLSKPPVGVAVATLLLRLLTLVESWSANPLTRRPQLDAYVYLSWAREIAAGDWVGRSGIVDGRPFFFNPLPAYLLAPFMGGVEPFGFPLSEVDVTALGPRLGALFVAQAVLAAAAAALTAAAAQRFFGRAGGWIAGFAVMFCAVLAQLDLHVAVSGLGAFLVAGTAYSCAPDRDGEAHSGAWWRGTRGPLASGLWLGIGALARPISLLALPFVAWLHLRRSPKGARAAAVVIGAFVVCALPTFLRNSVVAGEPVVYTAVGGLNIHLGNSADSRQFRTMASSHFRFSPTEMHDDARRFVHQQIGRVPSWPQVDDHFKGLAWKELRKSPGATLLHLFHKARWFASPVEVPSSASLDTDRSFSALLWVAWVPTWLLVVLGLVGFVCHRRRIDLLLGPGALVGAHLAVLTLVFPLSHYRSPAVPALAIGVAGALVWSARAWRSGRRRRVGAALALGAGLMVAGRVGSQPDPLEHSDALNLGLCYIHTARAPGTAPGRRLELATLAEAAALRSINRYRANWPEQAGLPSGWFLRSEVEEVRGNLPAAIAHSLRGLRLSPNDVYMLMRVSCLMQQAGDLAGAVDSAGRAVDVAAVPETHKRLAEALWAAGRREEAERFGRSATEAGMPPRPGNCRPRPRR